MLVTDRRLCETMLLEEAVARAVAGGVDAVQLREKDLPSGEMLALAYRLRAITQGKALLIINDRVDVAIACDADGVHLPESGIPPKIARQVAGKDMLVGRSVHSSKAAVEAQRSGADYLEVGTIFSSRSHPDGSAGGLDLLREVVGAVDLPILAIGGVTTDNAADVVASGANGAAVISAILGSHDPKEAAKELRQMLLLSWGEAGGS